MKNNLNFISPEIKNNVTTQPNLLTELSLKLFHSFPNSDLGRNILSKVELKQEVYEKNK